MGLFSRKEFSVTPIRRDRMPRGSMLGLPGFSKEPSLRRLKTTPSTGLSRPAG